MSKDLAAAKCTSSIYIFWVEGWKYMIFSHLTYFIPGNKTEVVAENETDKSPCPLSPPVLLGEEAVVQKAKPPRLAHYR